MSQSSIAEYFDGTFVSTVGGYSTENPFLVISFDRDCTVNFNVLHILFWDWCRADYRERFINSSDVYLACRPAGLGQMRWRELK